MSSKLVMFLVFTHIIGTLCCLIIEGSSMGADDVDIMNYLTGYSVMKITDGGIVGVAKLGIGFFTHGLPKVIMWDYSFLEGNWEVIKWVLLYPISAGVVYAIGLLIMNVAQGMLSRVH